MSKIFITGMTAPQASSSSNSKSLSFAGLLNLVLTDAGHDVVWASPSVYMTKEELLKYDSVLVGVSPITSVTANRVYGALSVISTLWGSKNLTLFVDAPNVSQIEITLKSVISNPESLTKPFFSLRKEYSNVLADKDVYARVIDGVHKLYSEDWCTTLYPALPWKTTDSIKLPRNAKGLLSPVNLDAYLLEEPKPTTERREKWAVDSYATDWTKSVVASLTLPDSPMKWNKGWSDTQVLEQISRSIGAIISPDKKDGTWWNYRYIQALNTGTPVATEWKESGVLSDAWAVLASSIDGMSQGKRDLIAIAQRESYLSKIPNKENGLGLLESILGITKEQK